MEVYLGAASKYGPKEPTRAECIAKNDPCSGFVHEGCFWDHHQGLKDHRLISNEISCSNICKYDDDCNAYGYYPTSSECWTRSNSPALGTCIGLIGIKNLELTE